MQPTGLQRPSSRTEHLPDHAAVFAVDENPRLTAAGRSQSIRVTHDERAKPSPYGHKQVTGLFGRYPSDGSSMASGFARNVDIPERIVRWRTLTCLTLAC